MHALVKAASLALCLAASALSAVADDYTRIFAFGSSWTANGFSIAGTQPSKAKPFGNTDPSRGIVQEGGFNYVEFLTERYNTTTTLLYDLAVGGGVVAATSDLSTGHNDLINQTYKSFEPKYSAAHNTLWDSDRSLFIVWMCDNDVNLYFKNPAGGMAKNISGILDIYFNNVLTRLNQDGASKFMLVGVPSQEYSQLVISETGGPNGDRSPYLNYKNAFDSQLQSRMTSFASSHKNATLTYFDTSKFMQPIIDNLPKYGFNANKSCEPDASGNPTDCIWHNNFHASSKLHDLMAQSMKTNISQDLGLFK